jgi:hypothetical protein
MLNNTILYANSLRVHRTEFYSNRLRVLLGFQVCIFVFILAERELDASTYAIFVNLPGLGK